MRTWSGGAWYSQSEWVTSSTPAVYLGGVGSLLNQLLNGRPFHALALSFFLGHWKDHQEHSVDDAVVAHGCVDIVAKFTDEQYTTINQSTAGRFDPRVFVTSYK